MMNIKEAENLSGVSKRNIRFYEQKGLLNPARNRENDYREYTQEDIETLKLIRALRMIDMPLEQIREVVLGKEPLRETVISHKSILKNRIKKLETAVRFCDELSAEESNIDDVLRRMDEPDNREQLSKQGDRDHTEAVLEIVMPLLAGFLPCIMGVILGMIATGTITDLPALSYGVSVLGFALWGVVGFCIRKNGNWLINALLVHIFPLVSVGCYWLMLTFDWSVPILDSVAIFGHFPILFTALPLMILLGVADHMMWTPILLLVVSFCLGGMFGWLWDRWKYKAQVVTT